MALESSTYRPDIDGLRALAIMGVLVYHLDGCLVPGGFVGVDVFFVISGFLISSIIDRDLRMGNFSIVRFYDRRIRRIVPALMVMICAVLAASWLILLPDDMAALGSSVRYVVAAMSNIYFLKGTEDYFNESINQIPLLHTWSLGVEEQFYLVFPLLLGGLYRCFKSTQSRVAPLAILFIASLAVSAWVVPFQPMKAFFLLPYRAWEMLLGALITLVTLPVAGRKVNNILGATGMVMIVGSMAFFNGKTQFPGPSALIPCVGTALLLWTGRQQTAWTCRMLSLKPWVLLGLISYSVYLWHWPMIVFAKYAMIYSASAKIVIFMASLIGGYFSWRYIEKPFRNPQFGSRARVFSLWGITSVCLLGAGLLIERSAGFPGRFPEEVGHFLAFKKKASHWKKCEGNELDPGKSAVFGTPGVGPRYALWGDSHGVAIIPALEAMAMESGQAFKKFGLNALPPAIGVVKGSDRDPEGRLKYSQAVLDLLVADSSIQTVILHARWSLYINGKNESGQTAVASLYGHSFQSQDEMQMFYASQIRQTVEKLLAAGKKVVLIYPIPEVGTNVPDLLAKQAATGSPLVAKLPCEGFSERQGFIIGVLDSLGSNEQITRIKPHEMMLRDGWITVQADHQSLYMDDDHLSVAGALYLKPLFSSVFSDSKGP